LCGVPGEQSASSFWINNLRDLGFRKANIFGANKVVVLVVLGDRSLRALLQFHLGALRVPKSGPCRPTGLLVGASMIIPNSLF
jgi:hypothetical protein